MPIYLLQGVVVRCKDRSVVQASHEKFFKHGTFQLKFFMVWNDEGSILKPLFTIMLSVKCDPNLWE